MTKRNMEIEFEATFPDIDKSVIRRFLKKAGAKLVKKEFLQKRSAFHLPKGNNIRGGWLRVRDEKDKVTMSVKVVAGSRIEDQKETCLTVDDMGNAELFLETIGCKKKSYQESRRELWKLGSVEITIDTWPFLEPFIEIEGKSEKDVKAACTKLGLDYRKALFCSVDVLYNRKYGVSYKQINNMTPRITFKGRNPFL